MEWAVVEKSMCLWGLGSHKAVIEAWCWVYSKSIYHSITVLLLLSGEYLKRHQTAEAKNIIFATYDAFSQTHRVFFSSLFKKQTPGLREYTQNFRTTEREKHSLFFSPLPRNCLAAAVFPLFRITLPMFRICYKVWLTAAIFKGMKELSHTLIGLVGTSHLVEHIILNILAISGFWFL